MVSSPGLSLLSLNPLVSHLSTVTLNLRASTLKSKVRVSDTSGPNLMIPDPFKIPNPWNAKTCGTSGSKTMKKPIRTVASAFAGTCIV